MPKKIKSSRKFKEQRDFKIYPVRKETDFINIERDLPEPFKPLSRIVFGNFFLRKSLTNELKYLS